MPVAFPKDAHLRISYLDCLASCAINSVNRCCFDLRNGSFFDHIREFFSNRNRTPIVFALLIVAASWYLISIDFIQMKPLTPV